jgi:DNA-binding NarL/FixJ family response regulator
MKTPRRKLHVLLIDEVGMLRDGLCAMLNLEEDLAVAAVISGTQALRTLTLAVEPDVVIADFSASAVDGSDTVAAARSRWPAIPILVLTFARDDYSIESALRAGVDGYLLKTDGRPELLTAIQSVLAGKRYISPAIFERVVNGFVSQRPTTKLTDGDTLSEREREVMRLIAQGLRTREIADRLSVSHKTVEKHRTNLMRKLGLRTAAAVAAYAISNGYVHT